MLDHPYLLFSWPTLRMHVCFTPQRPSCCSCSLHTALGSNHTLHCLLFWKGPPGHWPVRLLLPKTLGAPVLDTIVSLSGLPPRICIQVSPRRPLNSGSSSYHPSYHESGLDGAHYVPLYALIVSSRLTTDHINFLIYLMACILLEILGSWILGILPAGPPAYRQCLAHIMNTYLLKTHSHLW